MESIAIVGIGCRFADATDPEAFFELLLKGVDATREVPADRWNPRSFYDPDRRVPGKLSTVRGGFLPQVDTFDAQFFGISPREAAYMDPQQRLMLEVAWEALEDAGLPPPQLAGAKVGVFVGAFTLDYKAIQLGRLNRHLIDAHTATGAMMTMVSNRISYVFDFRGPSMSIDTACSSSLVAIHLACQSIHNGECSLALAGGVNVMLTPEYTIAESKGGFLAPDGRSKPFSAAANGYGRAEGAGVVVLKPLSQALADGDPIYALVRGSAVNQDGHTNGITVPSGEAQQKLIREACWRAGVRPDQIQYVEAHGTGTPVGDPIELGAIAAALGVQRPPSAPCIVGSVKGNIGHVEAGAGVAGLIKTVMSLKRRQIPPNLHFDDPNPNIPFETLPVRIPTAVEPWPAGPDPALAGVNSFGFGGTNAHIVVEESPCASDPERRESDDEARAVVFPLSARSPKALAQAVAHMREYASAAKLRGVAFADIHYTAALRRSHHDHRLAVVTTSAEELADLLEAHLAGETRAGVVSGVVPSSGRRRMAFVCTGMGPQWWGMGRSLFADEPVFRDAIVQCDEVFHREASWSLLAELMADEACSRMSEPQVAQTANFAIQVALAALLRSWGIEPDAIVGHSVGEVSAAYLSGALTLEDAIRVSFHRSRLQQMTAGSGAMMAVGLPADEVAVLLRAYGDHISIAAVNSPSSTTVAGERSAIDRLAAELARQQIFHRLLRVNVAYHSAQMDVLRAPLLDSLAGVQAQTANVPLYSTVTGGRVTGREFTAEYWWQNVRQPVEFRCAVDSLLQDGFDTFLEVGPHPVLATSIADCASACDRTPVVLSSLRRGADERRSVLGAIAGLYARGCPVRWEAFRDESARVVRLPGYPWQRERHWSESQESLHDRMTVAAHPLLGSRSTGPKPAWLAEINPRFLTYLKDHVIRSAVVFPGAGYIEMALAAGRELYGAGDLAVGQIQFERALFLPDGEWATVEIAVDSAGGTFEIHSRAGGHWTRNAAGRLQQADHGLGITIEPAKVRSRCRQYFEREDCYRQFAAQGFEYGPAFRKIDRLWVGDGEAIAEFDDVDNGDGSYRLHPTVLDACFQTLIATDPFGTAGSASARTYLPVGIQQIRIRQRPSGRMWAWSRLNRRDQDAASGNIYLCDEAGRPAVEIEGFEVRALDTLRSPLSTEQANRCFYQVHWIPSRADSARPSHGNPGRWLVFADTSGAAVALGSRLEAAQASVTHVYAGDEYRFSDCGPCVIDPGNPEHFARLLSDVQRAFETPLTGIAHLWSVDLAEQESLGTAALDRAETLGCISTMHLVQALAAAGISPRLWLVTRGAQAVTSESSVAVAQAGLWGLGRVVGHQEHIGLWGGLIDLDPNSPSEEAEQLADELLWPGEDDQIAFRGGERYVPRMHRSVDLNSSLPVRLRADASYLITGGLGALGLLTARWMVERGARRVILMGRTALPDRSQWNDSSHDPDVQKRIAGIRELESLGATIVLAPVDVADTAALETFLRQYEREGWPAIRGVVHSAGIARDQLLIQMDARSFSQVWRPKVCGAWNLHRLLSDIPLDFFLLYSSIGSLVAATGQANYAAGNAFLDALAMHRRRRGLPATSVNWGPWAVGMVNDLNLADHYAVRGLDLIAPEHGATFLNGLIGQPVAQLAVLSANWPKYFQFLPKVCLMLAHLGADQQSGEPSEAAAATTAGDFLATLLTADVDEQPRLIEEHVQALAARVMRIDRAKIDTTQPLNLLGLDSMMATELKNRLELNLHVPISVLDLLKGVSIAEIAAALLPRLLDDNVELKELLDELEHAPGDYAPAAPQDSIDIVADAAA